MPPLIKDSSEDRRRLLVRRLREQRAELERKLPPPPHRRPSLDPRFPRSHTMRVLFTEPALAAVGSLLLARLLGRRMAAVLRTLPVVFAALRAGRAVGGRRPAAALPAPRQSPMPARKAKG